jgi:hypothetical protein
METKSHQHETTFCVECAPAFPVGISNLARGFTKREAFAAAALIGLIAGGDGIYVAPKLAFETADLMVKEGAK